MSDDAQARTLPLAENSAGRGVTLTAAGLLALGVVMVYSAMATVNEPGDWYARVDVRHAIFAAAAILVLLVGWRLNYRFMAAGPWLPWPALLALLAAAGLGFLVFVPGVGHSIGGKFRWIRIGPRQFNIGLQPSELIKIALVIFLAAWLTRPKVKVRSPITFLLAGLVVGGCVVLVITQDFGAAVLIILSAGVVMFLAGVPWYYLVGSAVAASGAFYYLILHTPFRLQRILAMLNPWDASNACSYQARQSLLAILSGGWDGRGLGDGVRKLGFLPEDTTDFLFAGFCEEWGFRGAMLLIALLLVWMWNCRRSAAQAGDAFGRVLAGALGAMIALQAMMHMAVNLVLLPPTGISFPFLSAGGTGLILTAWAATIIVSVTAHTRRETVYAGSPSELSLEPVAS